MTMTAQKSHVPFQRATFSYSPNTLNGGGNPFGATDPGTNTSTLAYDGEIREEWVITDVDAGAQAIDVALQAQGLPQPGDPMEDHDDWIVARIENLYDTADVQKNNDSAGTWRCTIVYLPDPSQKPTEIYFAGNRIMQVVTQDVGDGSAIVNGAGDPYNPPVQEARSVLRIKIVKRYLADGSFGGNLIQTYQDSMSLEDWDVPGLGTIPSGDAYCAMIEAPLVKEPIWHIQAEFHFDIDTTNKVVVGGSGMAQDIGFDQALLNCGYQYKDSHGKKQLFSDDSLVAHGGIGLLNDDGTKNTDPSNPIYDRWQTKPEQDFNDLNLFS